MTDEMEKEKGFDIQNFIKERPTDLEIPPELERGGHIKQVQSQFKAQVTDDSGKPLIKTPQTVTIQIPATQTQLDTWSKGDSENAITWFAVFWIRLIKKAMHFSWRMVKKVTGKGGENV